MATPSYKERMRAARAEARAKRQAEKAEWHRQIELRAVVRRLSLEAAKASIRDAVLFVRQQGYRLVAVRLVRSPLKLAGLD
jgi:hypothetical protein